MDRIERAFDAWLMRHAEDRGIVITITAVERAQLLAAFSGGWMASLRAVEAESGT